jgi:hypothetical protein
MLATLLFEMVAWLDENTTEVEIEPGKGGWINSVLVTIPNDAEATAFKLRFAEEFSTPVKFDMEAELSMVLAEEIAKEINNDIMGTITKTSWPTSRMTTKELSEKWSSVRVPPAKPSPRIFTFDDTKEEKQPASFGSWLTYGTIVVPKGTSFISNSVC